MGRVAGCAWEGDPDQTRDPANLWWRGWVGPGCRGSARQRAHGCTLPRNHPSCLYALHTHTHVCVASGTYVCAIEAPCPCDPSSSSDVMARPHAPAAMASPLLSSIKLPRSHHGTTRTHTSSPRAAQLRLVNLELARDSSFRHQLVFLDRRRAGRREINLRSRRIGGGDGGRRRRRRRSELRGRRR